MSSLLCRCSQKRGRVTGICFACTWIWTSARQCSTYLKSQEKCRSEGCFDGDFLQTSSLGLRSDGSSYFSGTDGDFQQLGLQSDESLDFSGTALRRSSLLSLKVLMEEEDEAKSSALSTLMGIFQSHQSTINTRSSRKCTGKLNSMGLSEGKAVELFIASYIKGLIRGSKDTEQDWEGLEGFKRIIILLKLKTSAPFNSLIAHYANHGQINFCISLIKTIKEAGMELTSATYEPLIIFYSKTFQIVKAEYILSALERSGMLATERAYASLVQAYSMSENLEKAYNLIEHISSQGVTRTPEMYNPIIRFYATKGRFKDAVRILTSMKRNEIRPNAENFATLIHACASHNNCSQAKSVFKLFEEEDFSPEDLGKVLAAMIRVYAVAGKTEQAEEMLSNKIYAGLVDAWEAKSAYLAGLSISGKIKKAKEVFQNFREMHTWPAAYAFTSFMNAIGKTGNLDEMIALFESFRKSIKHRSQIYQEEQICTACCNIIHSLVQHNKLEEAVEFLQQAQRESFGDVQTLCFKVLADDFDVLSVRAVPLTVTDKLNLVTTMHEKLGIQPTRMAFEVLLEYCAKKRDTQHVQHIVQSMKSVNLQLNMFTYLILVRTLVLAGERDQVNQLVREMKARMQSSGLQDENVRTIISKTFFDLPGCKKLGSLNWRSTLFHSLYPTNKKS